MPRIFPALLPALLLTSQSLIAGAPAAAAATLPYNDFEAVCAASHLAIRPIAAAAPDHDGGEPDTRDCSLSNGTAIRLRWVVEDPFPFGECGSAPPEYLDLWVDGRRVLSRYSISEGCAGLKLQSLTVEGDVVRICSYVPKDRATHRDAPADGPEPTILPTSRAEGKAFHTLCRDVRVAETAAIDEAEFAAAGQRPAAGYADPGPAPLLPVVQEDPTLCAAAVAPHAASPSRPARAVAVSWERWTTPPACGETRRATFDFFNEGIVRDVYDWTRCGSGVDGDAFLVLPKGSPAPDVGVGEAAADSGLAPPPPGGRLKDIGGWHGDVFRYGSETYILAAPADPRQDFFLWRPAADGTLHAECSWRRR